MKKIKTNRSNKKKLLVVGIPIVLCLVASYFFHQSRKNQQTTQTSGGTNEINFGPPTEQEKQAAEDHKKEVSKRADLEQNPPASSAIILVTPVISSYGQDSVTKNFEATGYIGNIYESGGECLLTLTKDGKNITQSTTSIKDVNHTSCPAIVIPASKISAGQWNAVLSYTSSTAKGTSSPVTITVK